MHKTLFALTFLACGGNGIEVDSSQDAPLNTFASLLLSLDQAAGFNPSSLAPQHSLGNLKLARRIPRASSHTVQMAENFKVKCTIPGKGTGSIRFTQALKNSKPVVAEVPTPVEIEIAPDKDSGAFPMITEDYEEYGIKAGDILRFTTRYKLGLPEGDSIMNSAMSIAGGLQWQCNIFDTARATKWAQVTDALESNKESVTDVAVMILERPLDDEDEE